MIVFVLPVYNEEKNIEKLLKDISSHAEKNGWNYRICIANDGSDDSTASIAESLREEIPVDVVSNLVNKGPGEAFDMGFRSVLESSGGDDIVVTMEADNTSDLAVLDEMIEEIKSGSDLVLASCYAKKGMVKGTTPYRKTLSKGANLLLRMISRDKKINTFSSFYRCYRTKILDKAYKTYGDKFIEEKGFTCAVDILLKLERLGISIAEVPTILRCERRVGRSKMKTLLTILSYIKLFAREVSRTGVRISK